MKLPFSLVLILIVLSLSIEVVGSALDPSEDVKASKELLNLMPSTPIGGSDSANSEESRLVNIPSRPSEDMLNHLEDQVIAETALNMGLMQSSGNTHDGFLTPNIDNISSQTNFYLASIQQEGKKPKNESWILSQSSEGVASTAMNLGNLGYTYKKEDLTLDTIKRNDRTSLNNPILDTKSDLNNIMSMSQIRAGNQTNTMAGLNYWYENELDNSKKSVLMPDTTKENDSSSLSSMILNTKSDLNSIRSRVRAGNQTNTMAGLNYWYDKEIDPSKKGVLMIEALKRNDLNSLSDMISNTQSDLNIVGSEVRTGNVTNKITDLSNNRFENNSAKTGERIEDPIQEIKIDLSHIQPRSSNIKNQIIISKNLSDNKKFPNGGNHGTLKNYAIVVGINDYQGRMKLQTSVNDANSIANLLENYGYEIIKLTDETNDKPTKNNILNKALKEIKQKQNRKNVIFYFSGHGESDEKGNYFLVPADGGSDRSSYISNEELNQYTDGIKNLAIIVDACGSGSLNHSAEDGQIVMTSSEGQEQSNEMWFGPMSVFTYNLYNAMIEERRQSQLVTLERCFDIAKERTSDWARIRLLTQNPVIDDRMIGGTYCLNDW